MSEADAAAIALALRQAYLAHVDGDDDAVDAALERLDRIGTPDSETAVGRFRSWRDQQLSTDVVQFIEANFAVELRPAPPVPDDDEIRAIAIDALLDDHAAALRRYDAATVRQDVDAQFRAWSDAQRVESSLRELRLDGPA